MNNQPHNIILGTAQFGLNYGISNTRGQVQQEEVCKILAYAAEQGITTIDTAAAYGNSEETLGFALQETKTSFNIISKLPPVKSAEQVRQKVEESLEKLKVEQLHGYLLHNYSIFQDTPDVVEELYSLQQEGLIQNIGFSLYHPSEAQVILEKEIKLQVVQFPYNVFDQRFDAVLPLLKAKGIETHARSAFLQGLFFMSTSNLPAHFTSASQQIQAIQQLAKDKNIPLNIMLMLFCLSQSDIDSVVIGVDSLKSLRQNLDALKYQQNKLQLLKQLKQFAIEDENIILPYNWKLA